MIGCNTPRCRTVPRNTPRTPISNLKSTVGSKYSKAEIRNFRSKWKANKLEILKEYFGCISVMSSSQEVISRAHMETDSIEFKIASAAYASYNSIK